MKGHVHVTCDTRWGANSFLKIQLPSSCGIGAAIFTLHCISPCILVAAFERLLCHTVVDFSRICLMKEMYLSL